MAKLDSWLKEDEGIRRVFFKAVWFLRGKMKILSKYLGKPLKKCVNKQEWNKTWQKLKIYTKCCK